MKHIFDIAFRSIGATIMIGIGCLIYINHPNPIGAFFFSIGLLGVFYFGLNLFTGKIGYVRTKKDIFNAIFIFIINIFAAGLFLIIPQIDFNFAAKLANPWYLTLFKGFICGILIFLCVKEYGGGRPWVTLIGVPAFILSGAEHCIADMIYLVLTRTFTLEAFGFIGLVAIGNSLGSLSFSLLQSIKNKEKKQND